MSENIDQKKQLSSVQMLGKLIKNIFASKYAVMVTDMKPTDGPHPSSGNISVYDDDAKEPVFNVSLGICNYPNEEAEAKLVKFLSEPTETCVHNTSLEYKGFKIQIVSRPGSEYINGVSGLQEVYIPKQLVLFNGAPRTLRHMDCDDLDDAISSINAIRFAIKRPYRLDALESLFYHEELVSPVVGTATQVEYEPNGPHSV